MNILKKIDFEIIVSLALLIFAIGFNLQLYRLEPTAKIDPNDNTFQFGLVDRTNAIWDFADRNCPKYTLGICHLGYLMDHWVHNWAQGYNLPFYYAHWPQILIVGSYRLYHSVSCGLFSANCNFSLFNYYHLIIYLLLCFFPLPVYLALRVIGLPWVIAGTGAILATHISTDGLYGIDPPSFLWRGWGLSSQLFAMIWLPLAIAYTYKYFSAFSLARYRSFRDLILNHLAVISPLPVVTEYLANRGINKLTQVNHLEYDGDIKPNGKTGLIPFFSLITGAFSKKSKIINSANNQQDTKNSTSKQIVPDNTNFRYSETKYFWLAVLFLVLTVSGHLGIGMMAMLSVLAFAVAEPLMLLFSMLHTRVVIRSAADNLVKLVLLGGTVVFVLGYFIIPVVIYGNFHNFSFWDPLWKFHSFGWKEVVVRFFNGELFDWGRAPWFTLLVLVGAFIAALYRKQESVRQLPDALKEIKKENSNHISYFTIRNPYFAFTLFFAYWMLLYFGRTTWGNLIDIIPGMSEQHISRFIVGVHLAGLFLAPMTIWSISRIVSWGIYRFFSTKKGASYDSMPPMIFWTAVMIIVYLVSKPIYKQTIYYNELNDRLILQANQNFDKGNPEVAKMMAEIKKLPPARVFVGRGGGWGKDFLLAETTMFMHISTYGIPTAMWLPETWSPNSDTEQYFSEDVANDYNIYNLRWIFAPPNVKPQPFWKQINASSGWILYEAPTSGYFTLAKRNMRVVTDKYSYKNIVRLWIQSKVPEQRLYPELTFNKHDYPGDVSIPTIKMVNESDYLTMQGDRQNIFDINPIYGGDPPTGQLLGPEQVESDMIFKTKVRIPDNCTECMVVLKQTYHPNWTATVDGKSAKTIITFPFHIGVPLSEPGDHEVILSYKPHPAKIPLFFTALIVVGILIYPHLSYLTIYKKK